MNKLKFFLTSVSLFWSVAGSAAETVRGLCVQETASPGIPKAICTFPSCPTGGDCQAPVIEKSNPLVEYLEPLLRWQDDCKDDNVNGSCWEVYIEFKLKLGASDPAGIAQIGVNLYTEVNAQRFFKRYYGPAQMKDSYGRYEMSSSLIAHVPPGQRLELGVYELCARDKQGNDGCALPAKGGNFTWSNK